MATEKSSAAGKENDSTNNSKESQPDKENVVAAHDQAEADIENDPEMAMGEEPGDDLDEGEIARLDNSNDDTDLV